MFSLSAVLFVLLAFPDVYSGLCEAQHLCTPPKEMRVKSEIAESLSALCSQT